MRVVKKLAALVLVLLLTACVPAGTAFTPSPSATATAARTATPTSTATASPTFSAVPTTTPGATPITLPSAATISAPSGDVVWALVAGTRLFRSSDRGTAWEERGVPSGTPIQDIAFINALQGWLLSPGTPAAQCQSQTYAIYRTADGAAWGKVFQSDATDAMCKGGLFFTDVTRGFLTLNSPTSNAVIARTIDGGGPTWTRSSPLPNPPGLTAGSVLTAARVKSFGTTLFVSAIGGSSAYAFRSTDGGATWTYASTGPQQQMEITFVTATRWLQITTPGQSVETTDAGASWHAFTTDYQQAAPVSPQIVFGDANVGYATVRGAIQRTVDGGAHWTTIKTPGT
jgi:photosystem II stability/assembly factor-like uncharacterized protein